jgi:hypothetical protein
VATRSVIQVAVDDTQFKAFLDLYQEYQSHLESAPEEWRKTGEAISDAGGGMEDFAAASKSSKEFMLIAATQAEIISKEIRKASASNNALFESLTKNAKAQKNFADESERSSKALKEMQKHAEGVAGSIFGIGKWLLKLGAFGAGMAGLGGILSGLGLRDLASSAVDTQRSARGLGMTPGQLTAFNQDFGSRYLDPSVLGNVANAQNSFTGRVWLSRAAGESMGQVASEDPGQLAAQLAIRAHDWWANTPANMRTSEMLQSTGFAQSGFSLAMMRQLGNTPREELERAATQYRQDQGRFNVGDKSTDAWYGFLRELKDAGNVLKTDLTDRLSELAPNLRDFIHTFTDDAKELIDHVLTKDNLRKAGEALTDFTHWLESPALKNAIDDTASMLGKLADVLRGLGLIPDRKTDKVDPSEERRESHGAFGAPAFSQSGVPDGAPWTSEDVSKHPFGVLTRDSHPLKHDAGAVWQGIKNLWNYDWSHPFGRITHDSGATSVFGSITGPADKQALLTQLEKSSGLPPGLLDAVWATESSRGKRLLSPAGAKGDFGFMDASAKQYGVDVKSFESSARGAAHMYSDLSRKYGGDVSKMLAAYNWGQGHLDRDIAANGANWQSHLPAETRGYLDKILARIAQQRSNVTVKVTNSTSARVAVQANAAAAQ